MEPYQIRRCKNVVCATLSLPSGLLGLTVAETVFARPGMATALQWGLPPRVPSRLAPDQQLTSSREVSFRELTFRRGWEPRRRRADAGGSHARDQIPDFIAASFANGARR